MAPGKAIAQAGHAFTDVLLEGLRAQNSLTYEYSLLRPGTKVTLGGPAWRLDCIEQAALDMGVPVVRIIDSGHVHLPDFDGSPVFTALGIGPVPAGMSIKPLRKLSLWQPQDPPTVNIKENLHDGF